MSQVVSTSRKLDWHALVIMLLVLTIAPQLQAAPKSELIAFWNDREPLSAMQVNHDAWQQILTSYVNDQHQSGINRFNYSAVTLTDARKLKSYLAYLQQIEPRQLNGEEAKAYWINMFNALIVDKVVSVYQSGSNRAINRLLGGSLSSARGWGRDVAEVAMQEISLDDIEHGILRPIWKDPRIHFALSACTLGGANIQKTAFNGDNNEELLEKAKTEYLQHPRAVRVVGNQIILSTIFDWYAVDFGADRQGVLEYIRQNAGEETRLAIQGLSRTDFEYSWDLNAPSSRSGVNASGG